jgi:hypothetical protein
MSPGPRAVVGGGMQAWEDGDCPWCRSLLGSGRTPAQPYTVRRNDRPRLRGGSRPAWVERARRFVVPAAALTVLAALVVALA